MSENKFWDSIKQHIGGRGHFSRVESHETSSGIPDVDFCIDGVEGHIELKYSVNKVPKIRPSQGRWFRYRVMRGGNPWLLCHIVINGENRYLLFEGRDVTRILETNELADWITFSRMDWKGKIEWKMLVMLLTSS